MSIIAAGFITITIINGIELSNNHVQFTTSHKFTDVIFYKSPPIPSLSKWPRTIGWPCRLCRHIWIVRWLLQQVVCCIVRMGVTAGCTVLHYVTPAANFYPSALPRFWRNHLFIRDVGHPVETAGTLHLTSLQRQPILLFNLNKKEGRVDFFIFLQRMSDTFINMSDHTFG